MQRVLVARLHSLGDVILSTGIVRALLREGHAVDVVTRQACFPVFEGLGVGRILDPADVSKERTAYDRIVDLQANATSRRLLGHGPATVRQRSRSAGRRWTVLWGRRPPWPSIPHVVERYAEASGLPWDRLALAPHLAVTEADLREAASFVPPPHGGTHRVGLAIGASRSMKRWPRQRFDELGRLLRAAGHETLTFLPEAPQATGPGPMDSRNREVHASLRALKALVSGCRVMVTNDSGIMHLAVGLGVPVAAVFGSTVREFGFTPLGPNDRLIERELACRPCAPHGARFCWLGHKRCLVDVTPEEVFLTVLGLLTDGSARGGS